MKTDGPLILYVDDERPNRVVFEQSFGPRFHVRTVGSGREALALMREQEVAVLVTDQRMPEMSGHELLQRVLAEFPDVIRVVLTAYGDVDPILEAVNRGLVARYLVKPWHRPELEEMLRWAVQAWELSRRDSALQLRLMQNERLAALGSIVSAVVHDLNQPLASLLLNADRLNELKPASQLLQQLAPTLPVAGPDQTSLVELARELPDRVSDLVSSARLLRELVDNLRHLLQPAPRKRDVTPTDPLPIVRFAMNVCRETAVLARGRLVYEGPDELPKVRVGATELSQILINVIANAAQALLRREPGGTVRVRARVDGDRARFAVEDDGPGMPKDVLDKVGTPFFSTREEGSGLGVAQCKRLVSAVGGEVKIESVEGKGTTVQIALPLG